MAEKLTNAPIFYMIGQLQFNPVLDMGDYIGPLQKRWRSRYPDFSAQSLNQLQFQLPVPGVNPNFKTVTAPKWHFKNTDQTSGIVLSTDSVVFHTTAYTTSEEFFSSLLDALRVINETVSLSYIESVSIRTLDAVVPDATHAMPFFLNQKVLGISSDLEGKLLHSFLEAVQVRQYGQLTTRIVVLPGKLGIPADLAPITLTLPIRFAGINGSHAIIDNDCVQKKRFHLDLPRTLESLRTVKKAVTEAFHISVTAEALQYWG